MILCPFHDPPRIEMCLDPCEQRRKMWSALRARKMKNGVPDDTPVGSFYGVPADTPSGSLDDVISLIARRATPTKPVIYSVEPLAGAIGWALGPTPPRKKRDGGDDNVDEAGAGE